MSEDQVKWLTKHIEEKLMNYKFENIIFNMIATEQDTYLCTVEAQSKIHVVKYHYIFQIPMDWFEKHQHYYADDFLAKQVLAAFQFQFWKREKSNHEQMVRDLL